MLYAVHVPHLPPFQQQPLPIEQPPIEQPAEQPAEQQPPVEAQPAQPAQPAAQADRGFLGGLMDDEFADAPNQPQNPLWLLAKLGLALFMFSQNASTARIVMLVIAAIVIFVTQLGYVRLPNLGDRLRVAIAPAPAPAVPAPAPAPEHGQQPDAPSPAGGESDAAVAAVDPLPAALHQPQSLLQQMAHIAYTFAASLVPDVVDAVEAVAV
ncbi:hypothetical protein BC831DRAFT_446820 [Entophlyctis helioformis]|nr:hypothetical protein BC831DRAFT_446820 [Entophlyctis helioformis]